MKERQLFHQYCVASIRPNDVRYLCSAVLQSTDTSALSIWLMIPVSIVRLLNYKPGVDLLHPPPLASQVVAWLRGGAPLWVGHVLAICVNDH